MPAQLEWVREVQDTHDCLAGRAKPRLQRTRSWWVSFSFLRFSFLPAQWTEQELHIPGSGQEGSTTVGCENRTVSVYNYITSILMYFVSYRELIYCICHYIEFGVYIVILSVEYWINRWYGGWVRIPAPKITYWMYSRFKFLSSLWFNLLFNLWHKTSYQD